MPYILRLVQSYEPSGAAKFLELEAQFQELERASPGFPQGMRYQLLSGDEAANVLVWQSEFASLTAVQDALQKMADDPTHTALFDQQSPYIVSTRTEIYKSLEL